MTKADPVVIVGAARTPIGAFQGEFAGVAAPALGATAIRVAWEGSGVQGDAPDEVFMGCVLPAGLGQGTGAPGGTLRGPGRKRRLHHRQQGL